MTRGGVSVSASSPFWFMLWYIQVFLVTSLPWLLISKVRLCLHTYLIYLIEEISLEVTQEGRNRANNKLLASVK